MKRPVLYSRSYMWLCLGSFVIGFAPIVAIAVNWPKAMILYFVLVFAFVALWMRLVQWAQGSRRTIWSKWEWQEPYAVRTKRGAA